MPCSHFSFCILHFAFPCWADLPTFYFPLRLPKERAGFFIGSLGGLWRKKCLLSKNRLTHLAVWLNSHTIMKKFLAPLIALCLGAIFASETAQASSYYYTTNTSQTITNTVYRSWQNFVFNGFNEIDPVKGGLFDLLGVTVTINSSELAGSSFVQNDGRDPASVTGYSSTFLVNASNSLGYTTFSNSITPIATTPDWPVTIAPGATQNLTLNSGQYFVNPSTPNIQNIASSFFNAYSGVGTIAFALRNPILLASDGDNYIANTTGAGALTSMTVTYTYGVPEPSTYILFGLGGLALVVAYRRKRAA